MYIAILQLFEAYKAYKATLASSDGKNLDWPDISVDTTVRVAGHDA